MASKIFRMKPMKDINKIRKDFPILGVRVEGKKLIYLDNAATTHKPSAVIDAEKDFYERRYSNIHRGIHTLSEQATDAYEKTRADIAGFINAARAHEVIFTRNATESLNIVALSLGERIVRAGDNVVVTEMEHHSNLLPWQQLCLRKNATLRRIRVDQSGNLMLKDLETVIDRGTKIVAFTQMSNVLGCVTPVKKIIAAAKAAGAVTVMDGAQSVPHMPVDVRKLGCDFLAFSAHKMLGPTGVGVLYGREALLASMPPVFFGGDMVKNVGLNQSDWNDLPWKFEAGTPNIAGVVAFAEAISYLKKYGMENVWQYDEYLASYAVKKLSALPGITVYGHDKALNGDARFGGIVSFNIPGVHAHDVGSVLNEDGIAVRVGQHCCQPLVEKLGAQATVRMSFYLYNTTEEIDAAVASLKKVYKIFKI
jgi:cysteine desulfurase/selenocysteine lyase